MSNLILIYWKKNTSYKHLKGEKISGWDTYRIRVTNEGYTGLVTRRYKGPLGSSKKRWTGDFNQNIRLLENFGMITRKRKWQIKKEEEEEIFLIVKNV